jgi:hypothetical protein
MTPTIRQILQGRWQATNKQGQTQNFDIYQDAVDFSNTGTMIQYKGFEIDPVLFTIWKGDKQVFTAWWQRNHTLEQAQLTIDMSQIADSLRKYPAPVVRNAVLAYDMTEAAKELEEIRSEQQVELYNELNLEK